VASALARLGLRVIAIEADLRRPTFTKVAALPPSAGLTGLLDGAGRLSQELVWLDAATLEVADGEERRTGSSFAVLPAGELPPDPQRALADPAVEEVLRSARALADVVLIDTAPIGTVNDPAALARVVDSIALVVRLNGTTKDAARRALRVLRSLAVPLAGVVVTGADVSRSYGYYPAAAAKPEPVAVEDRRG
jgi:Mrp family chromosome partitioning ATPase